MCLEKKGFDFIVSDGIRTYVSYLTLKASFMVLFIQ